MSQRPNILFLMVDQMQARVLEPGHPCLTPNLDRLAQRGVRFTRAYTPNAVCSPARASLMTGLLPHSHGVFSVTHCCHKYHCDLVPTARHFAQSLTDAGYATSYFGKWHVEQSEQPWKFGWQAGSTAHDEPYVKLARQRTPTVQTLLQRELPEPEGYTPTVLYAVNDRPTSARMLGITTDLALAHLQQQPTDQPWCCFVSVIEPHDPFVANERFYRMYDVENLDLPVNFLDDLRDKPNVYRKVARVFADLSPLEKKQAMACYYATITEVDEQFGRLLDYLDQTQQTENTIVVFTSDHGEMLGAHQLYMKNYGAFEEIYNIPLLMAGPGITPAAITPGRVGLHDLAPTLCDLAGAAWTDTGQTRSFTQLLRDPVGAAHNFTAGYAEYFGTRYWLTQRVIWDDDWKLVWNGFDFDELYHLSDDPLEMRNRIDDPTCQPIVRRLMAQAWRIVKATDDHPLGRSNYPVLRAAAFGPGVAN